MGASITRAMRAFARWVSARAYRLILLTIGFVRLLAPVSAALLVLDALHRGPRMVAISMAASLLGVVLLGLMIGFGTVEMLSVTAPVLIGGAASGALLAWSRSLSLAFQGTVAGFIVVTLVIFLIAPEAGRIGEIIQNEWLTLLRTGGAEEQLLALFADIDPGEFVRLLLIALLVFLLTGLMLGLWWYSLITEGVNFGSEFRALKLGRVAGIALMALVIAGQLLDASLIRNLASLAVLGFLFQGLAVMHARSHSDKWPGAAVGLVYFVLVIPWTTGIAMMGLSAVGLLDNVFPLRARAKPPE
jgi:hypothetical protein